MIELVTDTHAFLWHLYLPTRLGAAAKEAFGKTDAGRARIHIPALVVAESLMVVQKSRLEGVQLDTLVAHLRAAFHSDNYVLSDLEARMVLESHSLVAIPDIFDRLIVAEAVARGLPLLTRVPLIRDAGLVPTVWE